MYEEGITWVDFAMAKGTPQPVNTGSSGGGGGGGGGGCFITTAF